MKVSVEMGNLTATLHGINDALTDLRPAFKEVHTIFLEFERKVFETEGGYASSEWVPLSPSYAAYKDRVYGHRSIMRRGEDRLFKSLTNAADGDHIYINGPSFVEMGTRVLYARAHQYGYERMNLPSRPLIPKFTREEGERVVDAIMAHLFKAARSGLREGKRETGK